jgi:hypothetical protein
MDSVFQIPVKAYQYVYTNFGWWGVLFAGLGITMIIVGMFVWFDRRK